MAYKRRIMIGSFNRRRSHEKETLNEIIECMKDIKSKLEALEATLVLKTWKRDVTHEGSCYF